MKTYLPILLSALFIIIMINGYAQTYESVSADIDNVGKSAIAWGDYDNDGDLDLLISGLSSSGTYKTRICRNDAGNFISLDAGLIGLEKSTVAWGDYDADGDLDILLAGTDDSSSYTKIYANVDGNFNDLESELLPVQDGQAIWGDYDNDGDLDIFITGNWNTLIYRNDEGSFVDAEFVFPALQSSSVTWGDYDNDGDLDILLMGDTGGGFFTYIFQYNNGEYIDMGAELEGLFAGTNEWVDFDKDGDLDISMTGFDMYLECQFRLYRNMGSDSFEIFHTGIEGVSLSALDWGDYDNDGDLDILMCGKINSCGGTVACIYRNDGAYFTKNTNANFTGRSRSSAGWSDYDNDGDLDALISGLNPNEIPTTTLYRNTEGSNEYQANTAPIAPGSLVSEVTGTSILLSWEKATDAQTQQDALNYNLRIGKETGIADFLTPMSMIDNGSRLIQKIGNVNQCTWWKLDMLEPGTYYWSVQAIDQAYAGSVFAEEQSFTILATGLEDEIEQVPMMNCYPNPVQDQLMISAKNTGEFKLFNLAGQLLLEHQIQKGNSRIDVDFLNPGIYMIQFNIDNRIEIIKMIKQ